ncbi:hypothetical protein Taro_031413, partial [Colocasia esculenta]|nr:hypothetical protein [Colocasia esculenta]
ILPRFAISDLGFVSGGSKRRDLGEILTSHSKIFNEIFFPAVQGSAYHLFTRNAGLVAAGVSRNLHRVANYIKDNLDDILYPDRRRPNLKMVMERSMKPEKV